jgi:diadenosine tetraphosphate (Ap4A) HIT family hydrolase
MKKCPFCDSEIINRQKVYETKNELVFYNLKPGKNHGRCVVFPKRHV